MPPIRVRIQLILAAIMWLVGASFLIYRGIIFTQSSHWLAWILGIALALGVVKSQLLLVRVANKAVLRIWEREHANVLGFFSVKSWLLVGIMMGGGITLRRLVVDPNPVVAGIMGAIYLGIGTALLLADRVFWTALFKPRPTCADTGDACESTEVATAV